MADERRIVEIEKGKIDVGFSFGTWAALVLALGGLVGGAFKAGQKLGEQNLGEALSWRKDNEHKIKECEDSNCSTSNVHIKWKCSAGSLEIKAGEDTLSNTATGTLTITVDSKKTRGDCCSRRAVQRADVPVLPGWTLGTVPGTCGRVTQRVDDQSVLRGTASGRNHRAVILLAHRLAIVGNA